MRRAQITAMALAGFSLAACGTTSQRQQAEKQARREAAYVAVVQHRQCHERAVPKVLSVQCQPRSSAFDCSFRLSDGLTGLATVRPGQSRSGWWTAAGSYCS
jgi:hypothetical protein